MSADLAIPHKRISGSQISLVSQNVKSELYHIKLLAKIKHKKQLDPGLELIIAFFLAIGIQKWKIVGCLCGRGSQTK